MAFLRSWTLALGTGTALLVAGCAAHDPSTGPTYACTPEAGGAPYACVKVQKDVQVERDRLYAEAEVVLRKRLAEDERIYRLGGVTEPTPVMLETTAGEALDWALNGYRTLHEKHTHAVGGEYRLIYVRRVPDAVRGDSVVTLEQCVDASTVTIKDEKSTQHGSITRQRTFFSRTQAGLKATSTMWKEVQTCA